MAQLEKDGSLDLSLRTRKEWWEEHIASKFAYKLQCLNKERTKKMGIIFAGRESVTVYSLSRALTATVDSSS